MKITLAPSWELTTDHSASSYGIPVLHKRPTHEAFGPGDVVECYPAWGPMLAAHAVRRMAKTAALDEKGTAAVDRFCRPMDLMVRERMAEYGTAGGRKTSQRKTAAARMNAKKGGRPKKGAK